MNRFNNNDNNNNLNIKLRLLFHSLTIGDPDYVSSYELNNLSYIQSFKVKDTRKLV